MKYFKFLIIISLAFLLYSCSASTGKRYEKEDEKEKVEVKKETDAENIEQEFNIEPYRSTFTIEENVTKKPSKDFEIWYEYENIPDSLIEKKVITGTTDGYRVQVLSTDNLEEANSLKTDLIVKTNYKQIYIEFDPPFYKVKVGDFTDINDAKTLSFKLNQMGYGEARVINETINIFE